MITAFKYFLLACAGLLLIVLCSIIQNVAPAPPGEYQYSSFLRNNYTILTAVIFFVAGICVGYYLGLNPWLSGICMTMAFFIAAIIEMIMYRGSHNLIPFEFVIYFVFALPAVGGVYAGILLSKKFPKRKTG